MHLNLQARITPTQAKCCNLRCQVLDAFLSTTAFIAEPDVGTVGIEVRDGMTNRPGLTRGHTTDLDSLTKEYARNQIVATIKVNFTRKPRR